MNYTLLIFVNVNFSIYGYLIKMMLTLCAVNRHEQLYFIVN